MPLDQVSIDMDWHPSYPRGLPNRFGVQVEGWTGYSVWPSLFPNLGAFLAHTKRRGVFINLNMHPASGIEFHEAAYPAAAASMGIDPASGATLQFDFSNQSYATAVFQHTLRPLDDAGLDYWWIDYQHGPFSQVPLLNPTFLTNFAWWTNPWRYGAKWSGLAENSAREGGKLPQFGPAAVPNALKAGTRKHGDRPYIFGRWGGLGGHRYPVGFAGDTAVKWRVLRYETFFSPTSSNVGFMWTHGTCNAPRGGGSAPHFSLFFCSLPSSPSLPPSLSLTRTRTHAHTHTHTQTHTHPSPLLPPPLHCHSLSSHLPTPHTHADIGGFEGSPPPELLTRWVQWGCFSALLRTHSSKLSPGRSLWSYPNPYLSVMRSFYRLRARLLPYIATAQRLSHEHGQQILRPMYYTHPLAEAAYADQGLHQFWWGPDVWVAPIAAPAAKDNCTSATGTALRAQTEARLFSTDKLRPGKGGVPFSNATLHARNGLTAWTVWVPPGSWIEWFSWGVVRGEEAPGGGGAAQGGAAEGAPPRFNTGPGSYIARNYSLREAPVFSRPGTILTMRTLPDASSASGAFAGADPLRPHTVDGAAAGDGTIGAPPPSGGTSLLGLAGLPYTDLTLWVLPLAPKSFSSAGGGGGGGGGGSGATFRSGTRLYEDDGLSKAAEESGVYGWSDINCTWARERRSSGGILGSITSALGVGGEVQDSVTCTMSPPVLGPGGGAAEAAGIPPQRALLWRFIGSWPPATVVVDGERVERDQPAVPNAEGDHSGWLPGRNAWAYGGDTLSTWVRVGAPVATSAPTRVTLTWPSGLASDDPLLTSGFSRTVARSLVCKDEVDRGYSLIFPSDVEDILNISATSTAVGAAGGAEAVREALAGIPAQLRAGQDKLNAVAAAFTGTPSGYVLHHRCLGSLGDAAEGYPPAPLSAQDPRVAQAAAPQKYGSNIEHPRGSMPGAVSQYSSTPGQDEWSSMEGIEDYYQQHVMWGTTNTPPGTGLPPDLTRSQFRSTAFSPSGLDTDLEDL